MVKTKTYISRILWYQGIGFLILLIFPWIVEISDLPVNFGIGNISFNWHECLLENIIVVAVAIPVMLLTRQLLSRLYYLEGFLRVCAWCKKLENIDEWIPIEDYLKQKFKTESSHGICPECYKEAKQKIRKSDSK
jgi:hypothetical protein